MKITEFLRARLDEDEQVARAASHPDQDRVAGHPGGPVGGPESWEWVDTASGQPLPLKGKAHFLPREGARGGHQWIAFAGRDHWVHSTVPNEESALRLQSSNQYMLRASPAFAPHRILAPPGVSFGVAAHIAAHDPARVLAEVASKRLIVDACETASADGENPGPALQKVLHLLALPYAGHPDYDPGWRP